MKPGPSRCNCGVSAQGSQALEEIHRRLNENRSAPTEADVLPNNNPMDLDEGYIDVEDPRPSQDTPENKHGEAQRLVTSTMHGQPHSDLFLLTDLNKSAGI